MRTSRPGTILLWSTMLISALTLFSMQTQAEPLQIRVESETEVDTEQDNWNSHIDNQAYLQSRKNRYSSSGMSGPVIIINRSADNRRRDRDCIYWGCDSWGVDYQAPGYSFTYREGYRPNRYYPLRIKTKPTPYRKKKLNPPQNRPQGNRSQ